MAPTRTALEGAAQDTLVRISEYPYYRCDRCGSLAYAHIDFNMHLLDSVSKAMPTAEAGRRGRASSCSNCHADLAEGTATLQTIGAAVQVQQAHTVGAVVQAPGFVCPSCGTRQLLGGERYVAGKIADALIDAFQALGPIYSWKGSWACVRNARARAWRNAVAHGGQRVPRVTSKALNRGPRVRRRSCGNSSSQRSSTPRCGSPPS